MLSVTGYMFAFAAVYPDIKFPQHVSVTFNLCIILLTAKILIIGFNFMFA